jgi:hypothetical protein
LFPVPFAALDSASIPLAFLKIDAAGLPRSAVAPITAWDADPRGTAMPSTSSVVLKSFEDGHAVIEVGYGDRRSRLEIDQLKDLYPGQPTADRAKQEISRLVDALDAWRRDPESTVETREP